MAISKCPECEGKLSTTTKKCIHCGADVKLCPECESLCLSNSTVCKDCGYSFDESEDHQKEQKPKKVKETTEMKDKDPEETKEKNEAVKPKSALDSIFDTWKRKEDYKDYEKKFSVLKVFDKINGPLLFTEIILVIFFFVTFLSTSNSEFINFFAIIIVIVLVLTTFTDLPSNISDTIIQRLARNDLYRNLITKKLSIKKALLSDFNNPECKEYYISDENARKKVAFAVRTQFYAENAAIRVLSVFVEIFHIIWHFFLRLIIGPIIIQIIYLALSTMKYNHGLSLIGFPWVEAILMILLGIIIIAVDVVFESICFGIVTRIRYNWLKKEMPEFFEFYKEQKFEKTAGMPFDG